MHPVPAYKNYLNQTNQHKAFGRNATGSGRGLIRRLLGLSIETWRRRRMIAAFEAMDTRTLRDIGIERHDIENVVDGYIAHERQLAPRAPQKQAATTRTSLGQVA